MSPLQFLKNYGSDKEINTDIFPFPVLIPQTLSYSDYTKSVIERQNVSNFMGQFGRHKWVIRVSGLYGYTAVALHPNALKDSLILRALKDLS